MVYSEVPGAVVSAQGSDLVPLVMAEVRSIVESVPQGQCEPTGR
ncbi:hypothetical protein NY08_4232 [Rhodococcus sp. B7740]|nr:hypothetical protein NY08_4232 [Rhodococcus sp. B7740]